jgi:beta-lactamase class A
MKRPFKAFQLIVYVATSISISLSALAESSQLLPGSIQAKLAELEASSEGRLGVAAIDTSNNELISYRAEERFPLCSTAKLITVAAILKQSMSDHKLLQERLSYSKNDLVFWSPITSEHVADGMSIAQLCEATITASDNAGMNLLTKKLGGPSAVNNFAASMGDPNFQLNRKEPEMSSAIPGDFQDTATPLGMEKNLQQLTLGNVLAPAQRQQLQTWLKNNTTGNHRIRAGVPLNWVVADKTGSGGYGTTNDIAVIWPPKCPPIVVALYFTQNKKDAGKREDVLATASRMILNEFAHSNQCLNL